MITTILFSICYTFFAFLPNTFVNYGYNYFQFLPMFGVLGIFAFLLLLYAGYPKIQANPRLWRIRWLLLLVLPLAFWLLRTRIHCFGGDGAVGTLPAADFGFMDFILHWRRLDGFLGGALFKGLGMTSIFQHDVTMPSILSAQLYAVIFGTLFGVLALVGFRKHAVSFWLVMSGCYVFNFFGNVDAYAFSLTYALVFALYCCRLARRDALRWVDVIGLVALWGFGLWVHPFHVFSGFLVAWFGFKFLRARGWLPAAVSPAIIVSLYGVALFIWGWHR